jgi:hypothetical protein
MRLAVPVSAAAISALLVACGGGDLPTFTATLSGANEVHSADTSGTGSITATLDGTVFRLSGSYSGLSGVVTVAHVHTGAAGAIGGIVFDLTATEGATDGSGTLSATQTLTSKKIASLNAGNLYVNLHTAANPGGEIRGQLTKQ